MEVACGISYRPSSMALGVPSQRGRAGRPPHAAAPAPRATARPALEARWARKQGVLCPARPRCRRGGCCATRPAQAAGSEEEGYRGPLTYSGALFRAANPFFSKPGRRRESERESESGVRNADNHSCKRRGGAQTGAIAFELHHPLPGLIALSPTGSRARPTLSVTMLFRQWLRLPLPSHIQHFL